MLRESTQPRGHLHTSELLSQIESAAPPSPPPPRGKHYAPRQEIPFRPLVLLRIKRGQYGVCISSLIGVILFVSGNLLKSPLLNSISLAFAGIALFVFGTIFYENTSLVMIKRLMKSTKVIVIVMSGLCNLVIECIVLRRELSPAHAFVYVIIIYAYVFLDAVITKSRYFVLGVGIIFFSLNIYSLLGNTIEDWNHGVVLFSYTIEGKEYSIMKRGTLRSIYAQIVLFSFKGIYTMFRDTKMKLMIFATGNVYKKEVFPEMQSPMLIKNRTKWAQRGVLVFGLLGITCYILGGILVSPILRVSSTVFAGLALISIGLLSYKNISLVMVKRLLRESDVIIILLLTLVNLSINIGKPKDSVSPFTGFAYVLVINAYTFSDSMISKKVGFL